MADRYDHGSNDGDRGVIISFQNPGKLDKAYVYIKLLKDGATLSVPIKYVAPTLPEKKGDRVIVLAEEPGGVKAGSLWTVSNPPEGMVSVTNETGSLQVNIHLLGLYQKL